MKGGDVSSGDTESPSGRRDLHALDRHSSISVPLSHYVRKKILSALTVFILIASTLAAADGPQPSGPTSFLDGSPAPQRPSHRRPYPALQRRLLCRVTAGPRPGNANPRLPLPIPSAAASTTATNGRRSPFPTTTYKGHLATSLLWCRAAWAVGLKPPGGFPRRWSRPSTQSM